MPSISSEMFLVLLILILFLHYYITPTALSAVNTIFPVAAPGEAGNPVAIFFCFLMNLHQSLDVILGLIGLHLFL